jgi:acyl carrier protein
VTVATTEELSQFLRGVIAELTDTDENEVNGGDRLREDLGLDSLQNMELLSRVSEEFDIDPDMEEVMKVTTVDEVVAALTAVLD